MYNDEISFWVASLQSNSKIDGVRNFRIKRFNQAFSKKNVEKITFSILCNRSKFCDFEIVLW